MVYDNSLSSENCYVTQCCYSSIVYRPKVKSKNKQRSRHHLWEVLCPSSLALTPFLLLQRQACNSACPGLCGSWEPARSGRGSLEMLGDQCPESSHKWQMTKGGWWWMWRPHHSLGGRALRHRPHCPTSSKVGLSPITHSRDLLPSFHFSPRVPFQIDCCTWILVSESISAGTQPKTERLSIILEKSSTLA